MLLRSPDPRAVHSDDFFSHSMSKTAKEFASRLDPDIDFRSLLWTFQSLDGDADLDKFFEALPRLRDSERGRRLNLQEGFIRPYNERLSSALVKLVDRTLSSNLVTEPVKQRRIIICTKAVESTYLLEPWWILRSVLLGDWSRFLECIEFGLFVQNWDILTRKVTVFYTQCVAALTISIVRPRDERLFQLESGLLDASKSLLDKYVANGDSIQLANSIFIVRETVQVYSGRAEPHGEDVLGASSRTLETVCKLDIRHTLPELQHEFCGLWNHLVITAQTDIRPHHVFVATVTLKNIRKLYTALHESSGSPPTAFYTTTDDQDPVLDNPDSYPMCTVDGHRPSRVPDLQFDEPLFEPAFERAFVATRYTTPQRRATRTFPPI